MKENWNDKNERWWELWAYHRGKLLGTLFGLLLGALFLWVGFWRALVFGVIVYSGFYFGKKADSKEDFRDILHRVLPEYFHKD